MQSLSVLRKLAEYQQYEQLKKTAQELWHNHQYIEVLPLLALSYAHLGQKQPAETTFSLAESHQADFDVSACVDMAAVLIVMQRTDEALFLLEQTLTEQPEHALGLARMAYCYMLQNKKKLALSLFQQANELEPERIAVYQNIANLYLQQGEYSLALQVVDQAFVILDKLVEQLPEILCQQHYYSLSIIQLKLWVASEQFSVSENWLQQQYKQQQEALLPDEAEQKFVHWLVEYSRFLAESDHHQQAIDILHEYGKNFPDNSELCLQLSELAQFQGYFTQAVKLLQKAIKNDGENIKLWVQLSNACLHRFDKKARHAAEKSVELANSLIETDEMSLQVIKIQRAQANNSLAQVESQEQNFDISEKLYRLVLAEHKNFLPALQGFGQQQMQQGNIEEALALFERVKLIDPIKGYSALINARRFPENIDTLNKMEKAANMPSLEGAMRSGILFQLASAWEKRKAYDKAFSFAKQANDNSKKHLPYDSKEHRKQCARIRMCFSKALYEHRKYCGVDSSLPVYVLGMPRSGTTLVEQILSGHSDIFGAGELGVIPQVIQGLSRWERHTGTGRKYPDCIDDLDAYATAGIAHNVLKELQEYASDAKHIVDKLPHNFENVGLIKFLFPNAKIISVRRDPRDIAFSNYFTDYQAKYGGMGFAYDLNDIGEQLADHNLLMHHWHQTFPGEILELNYEDVVDDLEGSARKMLEYIGVEWQPQVLKFNELNRTVKTASVWQVRQPIYKTSKAKWKRYEDYLAPLIKGTNAQITSDPIEDMITLPQPGFLTDGVALYKKGDLDGAELSFKKMLHHNQEHAACNYMLGLVYLSKHYLDDGIAQLEKALDKAPWHKEWRDNLIKAYLLAGDDEKAQVMQNHRAGQP